MNIAKIEVTGVRAHAEEFLPRIPMGIVGATVTFDFSDPYWDSLTKTAVFRGVVVRDQIVTEPVVKVPAEVVAQKGVRLQIGVFGTDQENNIATPTLWATVGLISDAADPSGDPGTDPDLPVWAQLADEIEKLKSETPSGPENPGADGFSPVATVTQTGSGAFISITDKKGTTTATITNGKDGADGGHYIPSVNQADADTLEFQFTPSKPDMPAVEPVQVELPQSGAQEPLTGMTYEIKPSQVAEAISSGRPVMIMYSHQVLGLIAFTSFDVNVSMQVIYSSSVLQYAGMQFLVGLGGSYEVDKWEFILEEMPQMSDIPTDEHINSLIDDKLDSSGGNVDYVVQDTPPEDTSVLWVDPTDNSDDGFQDAVNTALAQAKESGEFDGKDGVVSVTGATVGQTVRIAEVDENGTPTVWEAVNFPNGSNSGGNADYVGVEPAYEDIPKIFFGGALQQTKDEKVVPFRYISKTDDFSGYAEIKAQGNSSMSYPKKNQTVKMFADEACESKMKVDFKGWGKQNKHVYKANWIDLTHARNVVSARLWADVVKSRANYAELPELLRTSPNQGAVDGFPVKVYADGVYQGRYTLNIPKDKWTFNMDDKLETHCVLCGENYYSGCFRAAANIDESDWTDEIHDVVPASIKTRWNQVISFVMNSTDEEFRANLSQYFYVDSLIDYYLFGLASCGLDAFGKNQIYATYDGQRWIASMYDMDSTWGLYWNGSKFVATDYARTSYEDFVSTQSAKNGNLLYIRLEQLFYEELQTRWAELKNGALSIENIINRFERFTDIAPAELVKEDYASTTGGGKFTGIPSQSTNNIQQIRAFALARQAWTDEYVSALTGGEVEPDEPDLPDVPDEPENGLVYSLPEETTFNGTSDYIDTGIQLFDTPKDFTIVLDADLSQSGQTRNDPVFHCINETDSWRGLSLQYVSGTQYMFGGATDDLNGYANGIPASSRIKFVIIATKGVISDIQYRADSGDLVDCNVLADSYYAHSFNLLLGCYQTTTGVKGRFWKGTLYDFKVYDYAFSDDEITEYLSAT